MSKSILKMIPFCWMVCSLFFFGGCLPIHRAAYDGDFDKVKEIIEGDPSQINVQDEQGFTPLHLASGKGHTEIVEFLLNHGADIELETCTGHTPMMLAAWYAGDGKYETIKVLLEHGAKANRKNKDGGTALHRAAMYSGKEVINLLISYGADVNAREEYQITPLHQAAMLKNIDAAKALIENGADIFAKTYYDFSKPPENVSEKYSIPMIKDDLNKTAKEIALTRGDKEMVQYLQAKEEEKNTSDI
jgi:ankyrin repeat protein